LAAKENETARFIPKPLTSSVQVTFEKSSPDRFTYSRGGIIRGDSTQKKIALVFTGHEFAEGGDFIAQTLKQQKTKASFFFTGDFYNNPERAQLINKLRNDGHFLGNHSAHHLLYCDW